MPLIRASIEYLQRLPLYQREKPYWRFVSTTEAIDPDIQRVDNLEFEAFDDILVKDIGEAASLASLIFRQTKRSQTTPTKSRKS